MQEGDPRSDLAEVEQDETPTELLEDWREAERDADKETPGSASEQMARHRAKAAREQFHDAEDEEREHQGNHRPRKPEAG